MDSPPIAIGKPDCQHHDMISHSVTLSWYWANQSLPIPISASLGSDKYDFYKSLVWFGWDPKPWPSQGESGPFTDSTHIIVTLSQPVLLVFWVSRINVVSNWFDSTRVRTGEFVSHDLPKWDTDSTHWARISGSNMKTGKNLSVNVDLSDHTVVVYFLCIIYIIYIYIYIHIR